jgi:methyl-accepting chemotaxis protein
LKQKTEIAFSDLEKWIKSRIDMELDGIKLEINQVKGRVQIVINSIKAFSDQMKNVEINPEQVAEQYIPVINDVKKTLLAAIQRETSDALPEIKSFDDVTMLHERAKRLLNRLGDTSGSHSKIIHNFLGKYAKVLKFQLGLLSKEVKHLDAIMDGYRERTSVLSECSTSISRVSAALKERDEMARKSEDTNNELKVLKEKESELVKVNDDMRNSERFNAYRMNREKLERVRNDAESVLAEIGAAFARISRPLSKYAYEVGIDKESNYLIQSVTADPLKLIDEARTDQLIEVLNKVREAVRQGRISVKNPEKDIENIDLLANNISSYIDSYRKHHAAMQELKESVSPIDAELAKVKSDLERVRSEVAQKGSLLDEYNQKLAYARSTINSEINSVAERIDTATGSRVKIRV